MFNFIKKFVSSNQEIPENWHEDFIVSLVSVMKPKVYVELGLYKCSLFNKVIPYAGELIGVDISGNAGKFMKNSGKTKFVCSATKEFASYLKDNPIGIEMLFIDANHSKESVLEDFNNFFPFVTPHGLILIHDGHPKNEKYTQPGYCGNAYQAVEELAKDTSTYELMTIPRHPGLTIIRKRTKQLSWKE